jgi:hypothetical protein
MTRPICIKHRKHAVGKFGHVNVQVNQQLVCINVTVSAGVDLVKDLVKRSNISYKSMLVGNTINRRGGMDGI